MLTTVIEILFQVAIIVGLLFVIGLIVALAITGVKSLVDSLRNWK